MGVVHLKGTLRGPGDFAAFTLPPGYRPPEDHFMSAAAVLLPEADWPPSTGYVAITTRGAVFLACEGFDGCLVGIDGLSFRAGGG